MQSSPCTYTLLAPDVAFVSVRAAVSPPSDPRSRRSPLVQRQRPPPERQYPIQHRQQTGSKHPNWRGRQSSALGARQLLQLYSPRRQELARRRRLSAGFRPALADVDEMEVLPRRTTADERCRTAPPTGSSGRDPIPKARPARRTLASDRSVSARANSLRRASALFRVWLKSENLGCVFGGGRVPSRSARVHSPATVVARSTPKGGERRDALATSQGIVLVRLPRRQRIAFVATTAGKCVVTFCRLLLWHACGDAGRGAFDNDPGRADAKERPQ